MIFEFVWDLLDHRLPLLLKGVLTVIGSRVNCSYKRSTYPTLHIDFVEVSWT